MNNRQSIVQHGSRTALASDMTRHYNDYEIFREARERRGEQSVHPQTEFVQYHSVRIGYGFSSCGPYSIEQLMHRSQD